MKKEDIIIPVSSGELVDKISILKIKRRKIVNKSKLQNINKELFLLNKIYKNNFQKNKKILLYEKKLIKIKKGNHSLSRKSDLKRICVELSRIVKNQIR